MQTHRHGTEPVSLQRGNLKGGTKALEGWGFCNETHPLTDVLLGSRAHLRHLSTSSLSRKYLREEPCNIQDGLAQQAGLVSAYEHFGAPVHMQKPAPDLPLQVYARNSAVKITQSPCAEFDQGFAEPRDPQQQFGWGYWGQVSITQ